MPIFSPAQRQTFVDELIALTKQNEHIMALIAVGSGAYGYIDELSDIDMVIAVDKNENLETVMDAVAAQIKAKLTLIDFSQNTKRRLQVYMDERFLEIDIGYGAYTDAAAYKKDWKVLFDKTNTVEQKMRLSWDAQAAAQTPDAYQALLTDCAERIWHNLMHAAVAIKRGLLWRAYSELELARNTYIGLLGSKHSLDTVRGRELDKLPVNELAILDKTLVPALTQDALWNSLNAITDAVYDELEHGEQIHIFITRAQVQAYIRACRELA